MEKNGEFKPERENDAQKQHQEVIKTASEEYLGKFYKLIPKTGEPLDQSKLSCKHTGGVTFPGHHTNE